MEMPQYAKIWETAEYPEKAREFLCWAWLAETVDVETTEYAYRNAAWICDDMDSGHEMAAECRRKAVNWLRQLVSKDSEDGRYFSLILADVLRRIGEFESAIELIHPYLEIEEMTPLEKKIASFQMTLCRAMDASCHNLAEVPE